MSDKKPLYTSKDAVILMLFILVLAMLWVIISLSGAYNNIVELYTNCLNCEAII